MAETVIDLKEIGAPVGGDASRPADVEANFSESTLPGWRFTLLSIGYVARSGWP